MRLAEFSEHDITMYAMKHEGKNPRKVYEDIVGTYRQLIDKFANRVFHRTLNLVLKGEIDDLMDAIVELHNACLESEDDAETTNIATELKNMYAELVPMFDSL